MNVWLLIGREKRKNGTTELAVLSSVSMDSRGRKKKFREGENITEKKKYIYIYIYMGGFYNTNPILLYAIQQMMIPLIFYMCA